MLSALLALVISTACSGQVPSTSLTVFAASSLQSPFQRQGAPWNVNTLTFNFAGTQTLSAQLMQGAEADVFAAADTEHMKQLEQKSLIEGQSYVFAHNVLAIAVAPGNPKGIHELRDLARPGLVVILADPSVPAGKYAKQALDKAGVKVQAASLETQVTGVLSKVALGEADAGIVYYSDIVTSRKVDYVRIPDAENVIADYTIAIPKSAKNHDGAIAFVKMWLSGGGDTVLLATGFRPA
jgi:molybdate transport system substrate-binding protein